MYQVKKIFGNVIRSVFVMFDKELIYNNNLLFGDELLCEQVI